MASPHRLSDQDVQVIFSCIKDNKRPPAKLAFRIIRVPPSGLKLSPPSFEFADGIYVFLRSQNKLPATIPSNLSDKWISDCELALMPACPWSLSGPQFSKPLCMQQRYCYPRGNPLYSDNKGGALWTMFDKNKTECYDCRVLHVYHSNKRASSTSKSRAKKRAKHDADGITGAAKNAAERAEAEAFPLYLMNDDMLLSPLPDIGDTKYSFDLDIGDAETIFDAKSPVDSNHNAFSFVPVSGNTSTSLLSNPAFNSGAHLLKSNHPLLPRTGGNYPTQDWTKPMPALAGLPNCSFNKGKRRGKENSSKSGHAAVVSDFSKRLKDLHESIKKDILGSDAQAPMVHLLQSWAKDIAHQPLGNREHKDQQHLGNREQKDLETADKQVQIKVEELQVEEPETEMQNLSVTP